MKTHEVVTALSTEQIASPKTDLEELQREITFAKFDVGLVTILTKMDLCLGLILTYASIHPSPEELRYATVPIAAASLLAAYLLPGYIKSEREYIERQSLSLANITQNQRLEPLG